MSNQLQENLNSILEEKNTKLLPENLKAGVTCLGVTGELEGGLDTSDATATYKDIVMGKTAYVNGEKIEGRMPSYENMEVMTNFGKISLIGEDALEIKTAPITAGTEAYYGEGAVIAMQTSAKSLGLVPENIVEGATIMGVEGTGGGSGESAGEPMVITSNYSWIDYVLFKANLQMTDIAKSGDGITSMNISMTSNLEIYSGGLMLSDGPNPNDSNVYTEILTTVNGIDIYYFIQDLGGGDVFYYYRWVQEDNVYVRVLSRTEWTEQGAITFYNSVVIKLK